MWKADIEVVGSRTTFNPSFWTRWPLSFPLSKKNLIGTKWVLEHTSIRNFSLYLADISPARTIRINHRLKTSAFELDVIFLSFALKGPSLGLITGDWKWIWFCWHVHLEELFWLLQKWLFQLLKQSIFTTKHDTRCIFDCYLNHSSSSTELILSRIRSTARVGDE